MKKFYIVGQRWMSETEPELGIGIILSVESKTLMVAFGESEGVRTYGMNSAPLKRVIFEQGDVIQLQTGESVKITDFVEKEGLVTYISEGINFPESAISSTINFSKPQHKLFNGQVDSEGIYKLRYEAFKRNETYNKSKSRGFLGARISLIPHQFYVAMEVSNRALPRVLLADEVGLGKTIEAGLIIHRLICTERINKVLIVVPDTLIFQWLLEMKRKFNLDFSIVSDEDIFDEQMTQNPYQDNQTIITSINLLAKCELAKDQCKSVDWDLVVVDEAHRLSWSLEKVSREYQAMEEICKVSPGLLLLSATPEQLGLEGHFARLKLLDPDRFCDFESFVNESKSYTNLAKELDLILQQNDDQKVKRQKIQQILDRHGTGRVYFRNTRKNMCSDFGLFPKRIVHEVKLKSPTQDEHLKSSFKNETQTMAKIEWLYNFLLSLKGKKCLLISKSKKDIIAIEQELLKRENFKLALFHEDLSLMARDRNAAYFCDPKGATVLLCTEIGSEGRNFEFAHNLVLFDLPLLPDLLEQRIGRLDRIGQKADIQIYVPYIEGESEHILFRFYNDGLNLFRNSFSGANRVYEQVKDELNQILSTKSGDIESFIQRTKKIYSQVQELLNTGRDRLIELNSFDPQKTSDLLSEVNKVCSSISLKEYLERIFEYLGVDYEQLDHLTHYAKPGDNMFIPVFPHLPHDGLSFTYDRSQALEREDIDFMTWDHPMIIGATNLLTSQSLGNFTLSKWTETIDLVLFECIFIYSCVASVDSEIGRFFPPTAIRIVLNSFGDDKTDKWPWQKLNNNCVQAPKEYESALTKIPKDSVNSLLEKGRQKAQQKSQNIQRQVRQQIEEYMDNEIQRMVELKKRNSTVREDEIIWLIEGKKKMLETLNQAQLSLSSLRVIL